MDDRRFDDFVRGLATPATSRRGLLRAAVAAAATVLFGARDAAAASCRAAGEICASDSNCCTNLCGAKDKTGRRYCACPPGTEACGRACVDPASAYQSDPKNCGACGHTCPSTRCQIGVCTTGTCRTLPNPAMVGRSCDDRNACTLNDVCQADGSCAGTPVVCTAADSCHDVGTCDPATGACANPAKPDGSSCGSGLHCCAGTCCPHAIDVCFGGGCCTPDAKTTTCAGKCGTVTNNCGQSVDCVDCDAGLCLTCGTDHTCVSTCTDGQACCGATCKQASGASCTHDADCCSGACVEGTCQAGCSEAGGRCDDDGDCCDGTHCVSISNGVGVCCAGTLACDTTCCQPDTTCTKASCAGTACTYTTTPNCCTQDHDCPGSSDPCHQAVCNPDTNTCGTAPVADGTACGSGHQCCGGACTDVSGDPANCGSCGTTCTANAPCTGGIIQPGCCETGTCANGFCATSAPFCGSCATPTCDPDHGPICVSHCDPAPDQCHAAGVCQLNGSCTYAPTCAACETCDSSTGACTSACGPCERCDHASGSCVSTCTACQTCVGDHTCEGKICGDCEICDLNTGQCVPMCGLCEVCLTRDPSGDPAAGVFCGKRQGPDPGCPACHECNGIEAGTCSALASAGTSCGTCLQCDGQGTCLPVSAGHTCGTCLVCGGSGTCTLFAPEGTACGTCHVCTAGGVCVAAGAGAHDASCKDNEVCDGNGNCTCAVPCGGTCCPAGSVECCLDNDFHSACCATACIFNPGVGSVCST